ncbi:nucleoside recognition domain-containing protein [Methylococcus sp. EFPC2]|uniref:nucleoside recognition domain-containing protein n=1 Tax=Methylococcus sp. EFPC2 TaxID=2812648 RepID=UPI001F0841AD|nr:spore maturation protein [Methylococcus sp. EFPC2]
MLNAIWAGLLLAGLTAGAAKAIWTGDASVLDAMLQAVFATSKQAFEIALGLTGALTFWLGILRIGEQSGFIRLLTRGLTPLFRRLMPEIPPEHPAIGAIVMNLSANVLGLDNAATPLGIRAMQELQSLNPEPNRASNAQILFFVLNASSVTLFPLSILAFRSLMGAEYPADVFVPILLATFCSTLTGLLSVAYMQRLRLFQPVTLAYLGGMTALAAGLAWYLFSQDQEVMQQRSANLSSTALLGLIALLLCAAFYRRVDAYAAFIEGAKEGFHTAITIVPYLVAMLVAVAILRASGLLDFTADGLRTLATALNLDTRFVDALPTALIKPFSGSGARAMMLDTMNNFGVDSFQGRLATLIQGSTETTFYVLAVYFGAVGIRNIRHAVGCALLADLAGVLAAIALAYRLYA